MINSSRLEVGIWGLGSASAAYMHALNYALARNQGVSLSSSGKDCQSPIIQHPDIRRALLSMKSHVDGMRAMLYFCGYAMDRIAIAETEQQREAWQDIVDLLTPVCKAYPSEKAVDITSQAIQVYGGCGYTRDFPVEQFMRDCKVACIFEGTTGIQAIDFTLRKTSMKGGKVLMGLLDLLSQNVRSAQDIPDLKQYAAQLKKTSEAFEKIPHHLSEMSGKEGRFYSLLKATPFLDATGDLLLGYFLLWSALVAREKLTKLLTGKNIGNDRANDFIAGHPEAAYLAGKIESAKFFIGNVLPVTDGKINALCWGDMSAWEIGVRSFG